jgi:hypothetical protein
MYKDDLKPYRRTASTHVTAVRLDLDTDGFTYRKWGGIQRCKSGDWLVCNAGDTYTIDAESFSRTYHEIGVGTYEKVSRVWAKLAPTAGDIPTKEGTTHYQAGDMLVYNEREGMDGYAMPQETFVELYEPDVT